MVGLSFLQKAAPCLLFFFCLYIADVRGAPLPAGSDEWHIGPSGEGSDLWQGGPSWYHAPSPQYHNPYPPMYHDPSTHYYQPNHGVMSPAFASDPHATMPWSPAPATPEHHAPVPWPAAPTTPEHHAPVPWSPAPTAPLDETDHAILGSLLGEMHAPESGSSGSGAGGSESNGSGRPGLMSRLRSKLTGKAPAERQRPTRPAPVPATESFPIFESAHPEHVVGEGHAWPGNGGHPLEPFQGLEPVQAPKGPQHLQSIPLTPPPLPQKLKGLKYLVNLSKDAQLRRKINIRLFDSKLKWINPEDLPVDMKRSQRAAALEPSRLAPYVEDTSGSDGEARQIRMVPQEIIQTHEYGKNHIVDFWSYPKTSGAASRPTVIKHIGTGILDPEDVGWVNRHLGFMSTLPEYSDYVFRRLRD